jgi:hypothetical protein
VRHSRVFAADAQPNPRAKTESRQQERQRAELFGEKIERGSHVILLANSAAVFARAQARAAKIEAQHRQAKGVERLRCLVNHFVVHGPAEQRMRMANDGSEWRSARRCGGRPENRFQAAGRAFQKEIAGMVRSSHGRGFEDFLV